MKRIVFSNIMSSINVISPEDSREVADTRMILHAVNIVASKHVVVVARNTDVLLLFFHHFERTSDSKVWLMIQKCEIIQRQRQKYSTNNTHAMIIIVRAYCNLRHNS